MTGMAIVDSALRALDARYQLAANHSVHMTVEDAEGLSRVLARRLVDHAGKPDLIVGLANGALLTTWICGQEIDAPTKMVQVRRQGSRYKQKLLRIKEALHIPSSWIMIGPLKALWSKLQDRFSKLEETSNAFGFDVKGLHVAVVDDCIVTGNSLRYVAGRIAAQGAARVTTAVLCWTEGGYGGTLVEPPDIYLHRRIQWYPWSNNSDHWQTYLAWLRKRGLALWN
jgi:hypoxanthine phosphoribosyltransferase